MELLEEIFLVNKAAKSDSSLYTRKIELIKEAMNVYPYELKEGGIEFIGTGYRFHDCGQLTGRDYGKELINIIKSKGIRLPKTVFVSILKRYTEAGKQFAVYQDSYNFVKKYNESNNEFQRKEEFILTVKILTV